MPERRSLNCRVTFADQSVFDRAKRVGCLLPLNVTTTSSPSARYSPKLRSLVLRSRSTSRCAGPPYGKPLNTTPSGKKIQHSGSVLVFTWTRPKQTPASASGAVLGAKYLIPLNIAAAVGPYL